MDIVEIIFSIIGLIIYWVLTSRKKGIPTDKPKTANPPQDPKAFKPIAPPPVVAEPVVRKGAEPTSFRELLDQFNNPTEKDKKPKSVIDVEATEQKVLKAIGKKFSVEEQEKKAYEKGLRTLQAKQKKFVPTEMLPADRRHLDQFIGTTIVKEENKIAKLLQDPQNIRDAFIINEIFNRRPFDDI